MSQPWRSNWFRGQSMVNANHEKRMRIAMGITSIILGIIFTAVFSFFFVSFVLSIIEFPYLILSSMHPYTILILSLFAFGITHGQGEIAIGVFCIMSEKFGKRYLEIFHLNLFFSDIIYVFPPWRKIKRKISQWIIFKRIVYVKISMISS